MALTVQIQRRLGSFRLDVDFAAQTGEPLALLGASGCGKSMTLKCIAGVERPDQGYIELDGRVLFDSARRVSLPPQKRRVGYLFQQYALFPNMTVAQNIAAGANHLKGPRQMERTAELIAALQLEGLEQLRPRQLSGGQQQRTALARILASEPGVLLLDEPFAALDGFLKWQLELKLQDVLRSFPGPVLWVSHDQGEVYRGCRQVCVLDRGKSSPARDVRDMMAHPGSVSAARISGCKNFVPARPGAAPNTVSVPAWALALRTAAPWPRQAAVLGIRAGCVQPAGEGAENAFSCQVLRVTEDVGSMRILLRPLEAAADAPPLAMELEKRVWAGLRSPEQLRVSVRPEDLLPLEDG